LEPAKWADREASMLIRRTNNTNSVLDMSGFAAEHRANPLLSPILMFTSDSNKSYNVLAAAANESKSAVAKAATAVALEAAFGAAIATLMGAAGYNLIAGKPDDRKKKQGLAERFGWAFAHNLAGTVYLADNVVDVSRVAADAYRSIPTFDVQMFENPTAGTLENLVKGIRSLAEAAGAEGSFQSGPRMGQSRKMAKLLDGLEKSGKATADLLGIPISPAYDQAKAIYKAAQ
jgi:hypothetical protein